ncbi:amino acid adenylation domain-containing protein [Arsenicicoccus dermatophilus]|uniref:non-ribosomal peptide synthetase n=1 Tax=Arsenicicoccus dermatophilus TaxID=1076331 RepID=UPI001F4D3164|nr:amino acid adenylation domain-containing protein [Arsenicicoccus dermatophilus]
MSTISTLLDTCRERGLELWEDEGRLRYRAPGGTVTPEVLAALKAHKDEIVAALRAAALPCADEGGRHRPFALTDVQSAYLMGRSAAFEHGGVACHLYCEVEYPRLDADRAVAAWRALVARHDMLRVRVDPAGYQQVLPEVPDLPVPVTVLADAEPETLSRHLLAVREEMSHTVHPLGSWPMFGIALTQPSIGDRDGTSTMHVSFDFLVGDWASLLLLLREWEETYAGRGTTEPLPLQFRDYVLWDRGRRDGPAHRRAREHWLGRIPSLPKAPVLPLVDARTTHPEEVPRWSGLSAVLPREEWLALSRRARSVGLTPTAVVLTCYADVLARWASEPRFCLNLTVLDRPAELPELAGVVGDFTTVTLLEVDDDPGTFTDRARRLMSRLFEDLDHRAFSGVEVMREIARARGRQDAAMPCVFTSAIGVGGAGRDPSGTITYTISQTPQAVLDCQVMDDAEGLHIHWDGREGAIDAAVRQDMLSSLVAALRALSTQGSAWELPSPVRLPEWQRREREQANDTARELPGGTLHGRLAAAAAATPDAPALVADDVTWSHAELQARARCVAAALGELGVGRGSRVAVCVPRSPRQIAVVLGILMLGAAYVPIDVRHPLARRRSVVESARVGVVVHDAGDEALADVPHLDAATATQWPSGSGEILGDEVGPDDLAYVIFTSGSTGRPKGVRLSHRAVVNTIEDVNDRCGVTSGTRTVALADLSFDLSVYDIFGPLSRGGALVLPAACADPDPAGWLRSVAEHGGTLLNTVPAVAQMMLTAARNGAPVPSTVRTWILSGDRIPRELPQGLQETFPGVRVIAMGGATEAAIWSIAHPVGPEDPADREVPYGYPLANQRLAVLDMAGRDRPVGVPGEIVILGSGLAEGYDDDEQTRKGFVEDHRLGRVYRTGDLGHYLVGGEIAILGRLDDQVKIRGHRIELGDIESVLAEDPRVGHVAVVAAGEGAARSLHAFVVGPDGDADPAQAQSQDHRQADGDILAVARTRLPAVMVPVAVHHLPRLPLTANQKVDRRALAEIATSADHPGQDGASTSPAVLPELSPPAQRWAGILATAWRDLLELDADPGWAANPYDLGGSSVSAAAVAGRLRDQVPDPESVSFEALLRITLSSPDIARAAVALAALGDEAEVRDQPDRRVTLVPLSARPEHGPLATVVFSDSMAAVDSVTHLVSALVGHGDVTDLLGEPSSWWAALAPDDDRFCETDPGKIVQQLGAETARELQDLEATEYCLIGYSFGALVAMETARHLVEGGAEVRPLGLVDPHPVPPGLGERLAEVMFVASMGGEPERLLEFRCSLAQLLEHVAAEDGSTLSASSRPALLERLGQMPDAERWCAYRDVLPSGGSWSVDELRRRWRRYHHTMRAGVPSIDALVADAVIVQPEDPRGFLPGAHERALDMWRDVLIGDVAAESAPGDHFTLLSGEHAGTTARALVRGLRVLRDR